MKINLNIAEFYLSAACFQNIFQDSSNKFWFRPESIVRNYENEKKNYPLLCLFVVVKTLGC